MTTELCLRISQPFKDTVGCFTINCDYHQRVIFPAQVREELSFAISQPIEHPERFAAMGLSTATGVLLYGPPGACASWLRGCLFHS